MSVFIVRGTTFINVYIHVSVAASASVFTAPPLYITLITDEMLTLVRHKLIFKRQALPSQWNGALHISQYCY